MVMHDIRGCLAVGLICICLIIFFVGLQSYYSQMHYILSWPDTDTKARDTAPHFAKSKMDMVWAPLI